MATNQVGNAVDINTLLQALNAQNHLQVLSQQARNNTGLQEECQSENQGNAEDEENDFIAESESKCCRATAACRTPPTKRSLDKLIVDSLLARSL